MGLEKGQLFLWGLLTGKWPNICREKSLSHKKFSAGAAPSRSGGELYIVKDEGKQPCLQDTLKM